MRRSPWWSARFWSASWKLSWHGRSSLVGSPQRNERSTSRVSGTRRRPALTRSCPAASSGIRRTTTSSRSHGLHTWMRLSAATAISSKLASTRRRSGPRGSCSTSCPKCATDEASQPSGEAALWKLFGNRSPHESRDNHLHLSRESHHLWEKSGSANQRTTPRVGERPASGQEVEERGVGREKDGVAIAAFSGLFRRADRRSGERVNGAGHRRRLQNEVVRHPPDRRPGGAIDTPRSRNHTALSRAWNNHLVARKARPAGAG